MATRKRTRGVPKLEPSELTLYIPTAPIAPGPLVSQYLDLSQVASLVNRRFYRQGLNWAVAGIKVLNIAGFVGSVVCSKLPNTWIMSNAWHKSYAAWRQMNDEALEETESIRPRFLDFKIFADSGHHAAGIPANLLGTSLAGVYTVGEWESSKLRIPIGPTQPGVTTDYEMIAVGASYPGAGASGKNAVSLIEGYAASRGLPNVLDPNVPDDASDADGVTPENWMAALQNEGTEQTEEVLTDMITENTIAPYPFENDGTAVDTMYPGGANQGTGLQIHDVVFITPTTVGGATRIKGGNFPCGLIRFDMNNTGDTSNLILQIDLIPGMHRGYLAEPMQDM